MKTTFQAFIEQKRSVSVNVLLAASLLQQRPENSVSSISPLLMG